MSSLPAALRKHGIDKKNYGSACNVVKHPPFEKNAAHKQDRPVPKTQPQPQANKLPPKPAQAAKPAEQASAPEFLHRPSQNTPKSLEEPSDRLGLDD